jgi:hypothetical protein
MKRESPFAAHLPNPLYSNRNRRIGGNDSNVGFWHQHDGRGTEAAMQ